MDIEARLDNLENLVNALIKRIDKEKFYSDADSAGIKKSVLDVTPYTESKTAYILDTEIVFNSVPQGNMSVFFSIPTDYTIERVSDSVVVSFEPLEEVTEVTISIQ